ncbi:MAG: hypothetical protein ACRDPW_01495 [Mycobacteriales bacterium]
MTDKGLDRDGYISREGAMERVPIAYLLLVEAAQNRIAAIFGSRLHSAYLYGSIPRGTAVTGVSDLDVLLAFHAEPTDEDRTDAAALEVELAEQFPLIVHAGLETHGLPTLLSEDERYNCGFWLACLCTPLLGGVDVVSRLPRYRPTRLLALETNGDLAAVLVRLGNQYRAARTDREREKLCRALARKLVRTAFTLVMPRWNGWSSDLSTCAEVFADYYPRRARQVWQATELARCPSLDAEIFAQLLDDFGQWLADEYARTIGVKSRPP